jgi:hypothetical protein
MNVQILFKTIVAVGILLIYTSTVTASPLINNSNNSLELNITNENLKESGQAVINSSVDTVMEVREKLPDRVDVKICGFEGIGAFLALIVQVISRRDKLCGH